MGDRPERRGERGVQEGAGRGPARAARLADLKRRIASGQYESPEKLDAALRRLLGDLKGLPQDAGASREDDSAGGSP